MEAIPYVAVYKDDAGSTFILLRQVASGGQYTVDICLTMAQFSGLMAVLTGLESYFTNETTRQMAKNAKNHCVGSSTVNNMKNTPAYVASNYPIDEILNTSGPRMAYVPCPVSPYEPTNPSKQRLGDDETNVGTSFVGDKRPYVVDDYSPHALQQQQPTHYTLADVDVSDEQKTKKKPKRPRKKKLDIVEPVETTTTAALLPPVYFT